MASLTLGLSNLKKFCPLIPWSPSVVDDPLAGLLAIGSLESERDGLWWERFLSLVLDSFLWDLERDLERDRFLLSESLCLPIGNYIFAVNIEVEIKKAQILNCSIIGFKLQGKMNCGFCKKQYNSEVNWPRLLVKCGHSLCEKCLQSTFINGSIVCPDCKTINYAEVYSDFPKNLAL